MPEKHSRAMPPITPPIIAPVLLTEEPLLLGLPLSPLVSFIGAEPVDGVVGSDALVEGASVGIDDDESEFSVVCVSIGVGAEDDCLVVDVVTEIGLVEIESAVGVAR